MVTLANGIGHRVLIEGKLKIAIVNAIVKMMVVRTFIIVGDTVLGCMFINNTKWW